MRRTFRCRSIREVPQPVHTAEIFPRDEMSIERSGMLYRDWIALRTERQVRTAQQLDEGTAREVSGDRREHEVDRRGKRLRGQRQRIERLVRHAPVGEHLPREIEVRERPLKDDSGPLERRSVRTILFDETDHTGELLLT